MSDFDKAVVVVLAHEGGFVDDPADPGGATNFGISTPFLKQHGLPCTYEDVKNMTVDFAKKCYFDFFWTPQFYGKLDDQVIATKMFDAAVNMGPQQANRLLQKALGAMGFEIVPDGFIGSQTLALANKAGTGSLLSALCEQFVTFYTKLAASKPELAKFLPNWLHRAAWRG